MTQIVRTKYIVWMIALGLSQLSADIPLSVGFFSSQEEPVEESLWDSNFGGWVSGDLLYWTIYEPGFGCDFGTTSINTSINPPPGISSTQISETDEELDYNWDLGFRVGAGYRGTSSWGSSVYWTSFHGHGDNNTANNYAKWSLGFTEVDGLVNYNISYPNLTFTQRFTLNTFLGVRYAKINQDLFSHIESSVVTTGTSTSNITAISTINDKQKFWGVGPLFGLEGDFYFGKGFGAYGSIAGNFLYGQFKTHFDDLDVFTSVSSHCVATSLSRSVLNGIDLTFGLSYEIGLLTLKFGWEQHTYFDYNKIGCDGNLNLYGIDASAIISF